MSALVRPTLPINLQENPCTSRQNRQIRIITAAENLCSFKPFSNLHGRPLSTPVARARPLEIATLPLIISPSLSARP
jgi:hypothetical protein